MNILIVGNSHVGSLRRGINLIGPTETQDFHVQFAAARATGLQDAEVTNGILTSEKDETKRSLQYTYGNENVPLPRNPDDTILIYGLGFRPLFYFWFKSISEGFYSSAAQKRAISDLYENTWGYQLLRKIRSQTQANIVISEPLPASRPDIKDTTSDSIFWHYQITIAKALDCAQEKYFNELGVRYKLQPLRTIQENKFCTKPEYAVGSRRLAVGDKFDNQLHAEGEPDHMNDEFGALFLRSFFEDLVR